MIELRGVEKHYRQGAAKVTALAGVDLDVDAGEWVAVLGPSGSGKSTLMNVIGLLDRADAGDVVLQGRPVNQLGDDAASALRSRLLGFVFQAYHLLPRATAMENVALPLLYAGGDGRDDEARVREALTAVGLADRMTHRSEELSGGQQQRVAIARAVVNRPAILLADEPTGNLDRAAAGEILQLFSELHGRGTTIVMITHDAEVAARAQRVVTLSDGAIVGDRRNHRSREVRG
jgi:putative ABC transport system ATP-binding protein